MIMVLIDIALPLILGRGLIWPGATNCEDIVILGKWQLQSRSMIGENRQLVTDEPVEFEK